MDFTRSSTGKSEKDSCYWLDRVTSTGLDWKCGFDFRPNPLEGGSVECDADTGGKKKHWNSSFIGYCFFPVSPPSPLPLTLTLTKWRVVLSCFLSSIHQDTPRPCHMVKNGLSEDLEWSATNRLRTGIPSAVCYFLTLYPLRGITMTNY